jgi:hypothetical protein
VGRFLDIITEYPAAADHEILLIYNAVSPFPLCPHPHPPPSRAHKGRYQVLLSSPPGGGRCGWGAQAPRPTPTPALPRRGGGQVLGAGAAAIPPPVSLAGEGEDGGTRRQAQTPLGFGIALGPEL